MGCSTSSQTSAVDTTRPSPKPEESNGASATGLANENGLVAEHSETIQEVTSGDATSADESVNAVTSVPPAGEEAEPAAASPSADVASPAETPAADSSPETAASSPEPAAATPEQEAETTGADSETKTVEATDPSE